MKGLIDTCRKSQIALRTTATSCCITLPEDTLPHLNRTSDNTFIYRGNDVTEIDVWLFIVPSTLFIYLSYL